MRKMQKMVLKLPIKKSQGPIRDFIKERFRNSYSPLNLITTEKTLRNYPLQDGIQKSSHRLNAYTVFLDILSNCCPLSFFFCLCIIYDKLEVDNLILFDYF